MAHDLPEITRLFARSASNLRRPPGQRDDDGDGEACSAISSLAASLNRRDRGSSHSRVRVLDAALSLMCFKAPEVWGSNVKRMVETIVTVLCSSVACKVVRFEGGDRKVKEWLMVGSSFAYGDCDKLIGASVDVLEALEGHELSQILLKMILKVTISAPRYQSLYPLSTLFCQRYKRSAGDKRIIGSELRECLSKETPINSHEVPPRLYFWFLDPLVVKSDISEILLDVIKRPFLHLKKELHGRLSWRSIVICLATAPIVFLETMALLQKWFLMTGLASVLDVQVALVSSVLDVLSRPMWWGLSMEMGLKLPFSHAYFHDKHRKLLAILVGSISYKSFLSLVPLIGEGVSHTANHLTTAIFHSAGTVEPTKSKPNVIDISSTWAMLMNFPQWFYFASMLAFCKEKSKQFVPGTVTSNAVKIELEVDPELRQAATIYLAVILSPFDQVHQILFIDCISEISWSCPVQSTPVCAPQQDSQFVKNTFGLGKKLRKPRAPNSEKLSITGDEFSSSSIRAWLQQFHEYSSKFNYKYVAWASPATNANSRDALHNQFIMKITLGFLMANPNSLDKKECALLLHYAATGEILHIEEMQTTGVESTSGRDSGGNMSMCQEVGVDASRWLFGASLVFNLFDFIEDVSDALFETESVQLDYICLIKAKVVGYLINCTKNILICQVDIAVRRDVFLLDLFNRLVWWKQLGRELIEGSEDFDNALDDLSRKIAFYHQPC